MSVLPDHQIRRRGRNGMIVPFDDELVQPASIDVRLGSTFKVFQRSHDATVDLAELIDITKTVEVGEDGFLTLHPGEFVLGHTLESVAIPNDLVARVEGKSSLGRLGLFVHVTAGYIDPGFEGQITLEMACLHPLAIKLRPGLSIAQLSFHELTSPVSSPYRGRYQGDQGVIASRYGTKGV